MKNKTKIIILSVSFLLVFILLAFSIWFSFKKIKEGSGEFFSQKTKIALLKNQTSGIEDFKTKYNDYLPYLQKIDRMFVDQQNPLEFIEFLEKFASGAKVDLEISPLSFSEDEGTKTLSLQLASRGNLSDISTFLKNIEEGPYLLSIEKLTMSSPNDSIQANFSVKVLTQ